MIDIAIEIRYKPIFYAYTHSMLFALIIQVVYPERTGYDIGPTLTHLTCLYDELLLSDMRGLNDRADLLFFMGCKSDVSFDIIENSRIFIGMHRVYIC